MKRLIALLLTGLLLCGCQKVDSVPTKPETVPTVVETTQETASPIREEAVEQDFSFGDLKEWEFLFSSGAGSWGTWAYIGEDRSFSGRFEDHDDETGEGYPNGITYWCNFTGTFSQPRRISPYVWATTVETLKFETEPGQTEYRNQQKYVADEPRGLALGEEFQIYLPGVPIEELPEECRYWLHVDYDPPADGRLDVYGLYNTAQEVGFEGTNIYTQAREALKETEDRASALEERLQTEVSLTQGDMNALASEMYWAWDDELNSLWRFLKKTLDKDTMSALTNEQLQWISDKEAAVAAAGAEAEGGSLQPLLEADCAARLTKERVYYLVENYFPE